MKKYIYKLSQLSMSWSLLDQVVVSGGNFLLSILLARWLGLVGFGTYALWYMLPLFLLSLHQAFVTQPFQAISPTKPGEEKTTYANTLWGIQLGFGAVIIILGLLGSSYLNSALPFAASLLAVVVCLHDYLRKYCYALGVLSLPLKMDSLLYVAIFAASALAVFFQQTAIATIFLLYAFCYSLLIGVFSIRLKCYQSGWQPQNYFRICKEHYHFSFWLLGAALVQWIAGNGFILAAAAVLGPATLGGLRMAQQLVGICHVLFLALENTTPVAAAQYFYEKGIPGLKSYLHAVAIRYGLAAGLILSCLAAFGPYLAEVLFGAEYTSYTSLIIAYAALYVLVFLAIPLRIALRTIKQTRPIFWAYGLGAVLSLLLAYPMVETWGLVGTMLGLFLTQACGLLIYLQAWWRASARIPALPKY